MVNMVAQETWWSSSFLDQNQLVRKFLVWARYVSCIHLCSFHLWTAYNIVLMLLFLQIKRWKCPKLCWFWGFSWFIHLLYFWTLYSLSKLPGCWILWWCFTISITAKQHLVCRSLLSTLTQLVLQKQSLLFMVVSSAETLSLLFIIQRTSLKEESMEVKGLVRWHDLSECNEFLHFGSKA